MMMVVTRTCLLVTLSLGSLQVKKSKSYNYIGLMENVKGDEISAKFLKQSKRSVDRKPIFTFRKNDERVTYRSDLFNKLPTPQKHT